MTDGGLGVTSQVAVIRALITLCNILQAHCCRFCRCVRRNRSGIWNSGRLIRGAPPVRCIASLDHVRRAACQPTPAAKRAAAFAGRVPCSRFDHSCLWPPDVRAPPLSGGRPPSRPVTSRVDAREGADDGVPVQLAAGVAGPASWMAASSWMAAGPVLAPAPGRLAVLGGRRRVRSRTRSVACSCSCWDERPSRHAGA